MEVHYCSHTSKACVSTSLQQKHSEKNNLKAGEYLRGKSLALLSHQKEIETIKNKIVRAVFTGKPYLLIPHILGLSSGFLQSSNLLKLHK